MFRDLVLARVVEPTSILDTGRVLADMGRKAASDKTMRRTFARCAGRGYRDKIAEMCFAHALASGNVGRNLADLDEAGLGFIVGSRATTGPSPRRKTAPATSSAARKPPARPGSSRPTARPALLTRRPRHPITWGARGPPETSSSYRSQASTPVACTTGPSNRT